MRLGLATFAVLLGVCGCQATQQSAATPATRPMAIPPAAGSVTTAVPTVVVVHGQVAEACLGGAGGTRPPTCAAAVPVLGWDWTDQPGMAEQGGARWGEFVVTGTFDGVSLTVSDLVPASGEPDDAVPADPACPEPAGGWSVVDPALGSERDLRRATTAALAFDDVGEVRVEAVAVDPGPAERSLLVVSVTGDVGTAEEALRQVWGGMLCVVHAEHGRVELTAAQRETTSVPGVLGSGLGHDRLDLLVVHDDGSYQRWADAEFGPGVVLVTSALVPV